MDLQLKDRSAVVTGASKGIGLATARLLTDEGVRVLGVARVPTPEMKEVVSLAVSADLTTPSGVTAVASAAESWAPEGLDLLVNNAGGLAPGDGDPSHLGGFATIDDAAWDRTLELNLLSAVRVTRSLVPSLLRRGGVIVNVSSIGARIAHPPIDYGVAKAALTNLTKALSEEYAPCGMRAVTVSPGPTRTRNWTDSDSLAGALSRSRGIGQDELLAGLPKDAGISIGRIIEPEEVASAIAFLASPQAGAITGSDVLVDGGVIKTV
ncbi:MULTISPECIES: SDR family oxidoreductase [Streptomyces]|uniref:SDR family oxidoreductase n=1 Tax=Streptomyces lycopersici TaxID=2974589 RepID=UPI0021D1759E|nr:SDR family oxidoreductase [Streptomyces sp. NEAU-383]